MRPLSIGLLFALVSVAFGVEHVMDEKLTQPIGVHMALSRPVNRAQGGCMDVYTQ